MSVPETDRDLMVVAEEVKCTVRRIVAGLVAPYDDQVQEWALGVYWQFPSNLRDEHPLAAAIEACLVDILSCDDAPWDTPLQGFEEDLRRLETALRRLREQSRDDSRQ